MIFHLAVIAQCALAHHKGHIQPLFQQRAEALHGLGQLGIGGFLADHKAGNAHILQQLQGHFALINVLGLIVDAGLAAPADDKDHGNGVNLIVQQRGSGVDDVALAAVLHIHHGHLAGGQMITGSQRGAVALVGGNDMMLRVNAVGVHQAVAQCLQLRIRHAGVKIGA